MVHQISLLEAWQQWLAGPIEHDVLLWGHSLVFWARLGKVLEVVGAFSIICDIAGPKRLQEWGHRVGTLGIENLSKESFNRIYFSVVLPFAAGGAVVGDWWFFTRGDGATIWRESVEQIGLIWTIVCLVSPLGWMTWFFPAVIGSMAGITVGALALIWMLLFIRIIIAAVVYLLDRPNADVALRLVYFNFLLLGFHFDLLGS